MHNPAGSNDRNCERNVNRNNGNRLFDSQNNNKGGYACPRATGSGTFQPEDKQVPFSAVDVNTGTTSVFTQNTKMYFYEGSLLPLEWTEQHGCGGNSKVSCEVVVQYACEDTLDPKIDYFWPEGPSKNEDEQTYRVDVDNIAAPRDGVPRDADDSATDTIPDNAASAVPDTTETRRFGMHEGYDSYQICQHTERNKGLYTADQRVRRNDRRGTRQNPNGNRNGLECPEERDYYPHWAPSPWIDIAVLTDNAASNVCFYKDKDDETKCSPRCKYYMENTMNFNYKGYCDVNRTATPPQDKADKFNSQAWNQNSWYNNREACESNAFVWYEVSHKDNLDLAGNSFVCAMTGFARVNQLGNSADGTVVSQNEQPGTQAGAINNNVVDGLNANRFMWTIPNISSSSVDPAYFDSMTDAYKSCAIRIRYNISSADMQQWPADANNPNSTLMVDSRNNSNPPLKQDPYVIIGPGDSGDKGEQFVSLKVNTNQYSRTFQDRSYTFSIRPVPTTGEDTAASPKYDTPKIDGTSMQSNLAAGGKIYNVNVRGKRGNIVQTYPAVEYDFTPNMLALGVNDMIHFQWTGSDYNPRRGCNDGTGGPPDLNTYSTATNADQNSRADRSNLIFTDHMANNVPSDYLGYNGIEPNISFAEQKSMQFETVMADAPCYDATTDTDSTKQECYDSIMRLAYLNQQSDVGSLLLRQALPCLTREELNEIANEEIADNHPLNCAKLNAKPFPYFDGGVVPMKKTGWWPFFSSRNNNFSNRQNIGVICVGGNCAVNPANGVLQDENPQTNGASTATVSMGASGDDAATSPCYDTTGAVGQGTATGVSSCSTASTTITSGETFYTANQDNDGYGDGQTTGCAALTLTDTASIGGSDSGGSDSEAVGLGIGLTLVGIVCLAIAYYLYTQMRKRQEESQELEGSFKTTSENGQNRKSARLSWSHAHSPGGAKKTNTPAGANPTSKKQQSYEQIEMGGVPPQGVPPKPPPPARMGGEPPKVSAPKPPPRNVTESGSHI